MIMRLCFVCCALLFFISPLSEVKGSEAGTHFDDALITDRPDTAEASQTVGKLRFQLETSFGFNHDRDAGVTTQTYSFPTLLRFGIIDPLEVRLEGEMLAIETQTGAEREVGFTDLSFGVKGHLCDNNGLLPSTGLLLHLSVPTGGDHFSSKTVEPAFKLLMDWELPFDFSLGTNLGFDIPARDAAGNKFARFLYAIALGHPIPGTQERLRIFAEIAGAVPAEEGTSDEHTFDSGLAFLITPNMQVDAVTQIGLTAAAPDLAAGIGFSKRF